ncbi:MAG: ThuA domain-containing protein [Gemmataceae bacterium]|nr:ThuA domain-containing protein [Gemmataceae bacterium]
MRSLVALRSLLVLVAVTLPLLGADREPKPLQVLFLGDNGGHRPAERFKQLQGVFATRGITLTYTDKLDDLNAKTLASYDALLIYANHTQIRPEQEKALLDFVAGGKGLVAVHCASYCFHNSPKYIELVGAQFKSHNSGTFRTQIVQPQHPIMTGFGGFTSWDETYVHTKHNEKGRTVLEVRAEGDVKEPWTWIREHGQGRVFYTAWGHDQRTWGHPGFHNLLERGVRWACGQDPTQAGPYSEPVKYEKPKMTEPRKDVKPFEYVEAKVPFYPPRGGQRGPLTKMQKPLPVEESLKHFVTPVDFVVKPFVTEKDLGGKPIAMTWDEYGRLFVSVTVDYPNDLQPPGRGNDKIVICEDTTGDGVCDKVTTFADKLSIATSLLPYAGGLIVHQAPVTLFLQDTDGDGQADVRQELFRGWSTYDTHAGPSNLRYGFDGWIYGAVGYAGFNGTVAGERHNFRQGFYRFRVERNVGADARRAPLKVTQLEFLRSTSNNTWGLNFNETGELFGSTANGCPIVHLPLANRYYEKVNGLAPSVLANIAPDNHIEPITDKIRQVDWHGGFTAASHIAVYTARTYPREYWNRTAFISEPTGHLTATMTLEPTGTNFRANYGWNLVASDDEWTAPIDAQVGPDGHVWVIDWYAFIVQHNPTPAGFTNGRGNAYETPLRDKTHGRIYRVVYTKAPEEKPFTLQDATPAQLVATLRHPNLTWRLHAQRLLIDRGQEDVIPALYKLLEDRSVDETGLNAGALHALWTLRGLARTEAQQLALLAAIEKHAMKHPSSAVRAAACWTAPKTDTTAAVLASAATDPALPVRKALLLSLFDVTGKDWPNRGTVLVRMLNDPANLADRTLAEALGLAAAAHPTPFLQDLATLTNSAAQQAAVRSIVELAARNFALRGAANDLEPILVNLARPTTPLAATEAVIAGWAAAGSLRGKGQLSAEAHQALVTLLTKVTPSTRGKLLKLAATWGVQGIEEQLKDLTKAALATLADAKATDATRLTAAQQILELLPESDEAATQLLEAIGPTSSPTFATALLELLAQSKAKAIGPAVVAKLPHLPVAARPAALRIVLAKTDSTRAFLEAVDQGTLRFDMLALDQRTALANHPDPTISRRARQLLELGGGLPNPDRQKVIDELKAALMKPGNADNGKKMFLAHCAKCHKHGNDGNAIGPDLTGFGVHPREEMIIAILDPSRSVEGNFKLYRVTTSDERTILGILGAQTATTLEVIDADAKRHTLAKADIVSWKETDKSLMPEGFEKVMQATELADLLEFLSQKGKFVPLPLDKVATVISTKDMFFDAGGITERLIFPDWKPKTFNDVPFVLVDPQKDQVKNVIMLYGPQGKIPPTMPKNVRLPFNGPAKAIHLLSGISGWGALDNNAPKTVSMIVRLTYADGQTEDHELRNGVHFADYIRRFDVPESKFAFALRNQQVRYLAITPKRPDAVIKTIEFVKGPDRTAPIVMAVTVETP